MQIPIILASVSVLINIIQFIIGLGKDRRLKKYEDLEYSVRLRLIDEELTLPEEDSSQALSYSAKIENCSSKTVTIEAIKALWEGIETPTWGQMDLIELRSFLTPGEKKEIRINYTSEQFDKIKERLQTWESKLNLQIFYINALGESIERKIPLARFTQRGEMMRGRWTNTIT